MHFLDDTSVNRSVIMAWTLRFSDVLDADKLHHALTRLLEIGDWRKLGGRLRKVDGKLQIHVPSEFTSTRPAVRYSYETIDVSIDDHALGSRLPQPTDHISLGPSSREFRAFLPPGGPAHIDDYLLSDQPQLSLHIVVFTDATLVSLTWPHTLTDAMGRYAIVTNWSKVLAGKEDEVTPLLGVYEDPLADLGTGPVPKEEEPYALEPMLLKGLGLVNFAVRFMWDSFWRPNQEQHIMCVPAKSIAALRESATKDLSADDTSAPFVSDGDILTAWLTRLTCLGMPADPQQSLAVMNVFDIRSRLPNLFNSPGVYVNNLLAFAVTHLTAGEALTLPLGKLALQFRESLEAQITEGQVRSRLRLTRKQAGAPMLFMEPSAFMISGSNWTKARFFDAVDFSPAVIKTGKPFVPASASATAARVTAPGKPVYYHSVLVLDVSMLRNIFNILGRDAAGNYWINVVLNPDHWPKIEEEIKKM